MARVYVGTYAKYNSGSINGAWLDCDDYAGIDDFIEACQALHSDEHDPELMFQDYEGFPAAYYNESSIAEELWGWLALNDDERELIAAYQHCFDDTGTIEQARDAFMGTANSERDFAEQRVDDSGLLDQIPEHLRYYFDYEAYARDLFMNLIFHEGYVFIRC
jgi:antirestriction protein